MDWKIIMKISLLTNSFPIAMSDKKINRYMIMRHGEHNWYYWIPALPKLLKFVSSNIINIK